MPFIELTLSQSSEPVTINIDSIVLFEQKPLHAGGYVSLALQGGKEFTVIESYEQVREAVVRAATTGRSVLLSKPAEEDEPAEILDT